MASIWFVRRIPRKRDAPPDYLHISLRRPFARPDGWAAWSAAGLVVAPPVILAVSSVLDLLPASTQLGAGTVGALADMVNSADPAVFLNLGLTAGVLAPILEECVFRGFLLPSLSARMPMPAAIAVSSAAFALCHANLRDLPALFTIGVILGVAYARSRNLMTTIVIHGTWNSATLAILYVLLRSGASLEDIV